MTGPGPLYEMAGLPPPPSEPEVIDADSDAWANVGSGIDDEAAKAPVVVEGEADVGSDEPEVVEPKLIAPELVEADDACLSCDNEGEIIVLDPLPRSQFRVPARDVWGRSVNPYDPLRGWRR